MPKFMILMQENDHAWSRLAPEEQQRLLEKYYAWARELKEKDFMRGGDALSDGGRELRVVGGDVVDAPYTETKEVVTGYFLIEAPDLEAAAQIARGCPALGHGETVLVRRTGHHSED